MLKKVFSHQSVGVFSSLGGRAVMVGGNLDFHLGMEKGFGL